MLKRMKPHLKQIAFAVMLIVLTSCAVKPPVQEMAEARTAIAAARSIVSETDASNRELKSAEQALKEAADAIGLQRFERARRLALEAKRKAQKAVSYKKSRR